MSAKQSGWPKNTVDYRVWRLMQKLVYIVHNTWPRHQRLAATHQWHMGKHTTEFAKTSTILEFYFRFRFLLNHRSGHVILHQSAIFCMKIDLTSYFCRGRSARGKNMTSDRSSRWQISTIVDFRGPIMGSLKSQCTTSCRSSIETIVMHCLVFEKIAFCVLSPRLLAEPWRLRELTQM